MDSARVTSLSKRFELRNLGSKLRLGIADVLEGSGARFYWDSTSTATDNDVTIFKPNDIDTGSPGRWISYPYDYLNVLRCGAVGKGEVDNTTLTLNETAINLALTISTKVLIPVGVHYRRGNLVGSKNKIIRDESRFIPITNNDPDWQVSNRQVELIAHRCWPYQAPESTLPAMSKAILAGTKSLETDWMITKNGYVVCHHDDTAARCSNNALTGNIWDYNLSELQAVEWGSFFSPTYSGTPILTGVDFVKYAKSVGARIYPEIKNYRTQSDIDLMIDAVVSNEMDSQTTFTSFTLSDLTYVRSKNKRITLGLAASDITYVEDMARLGNGNQIWIPQATILANPSWVTTARNAGVDLVPWTLGNSNGGNYQDLINLGIFRFVCNDIF